MMKKAVTSYVNAPLVMRNFTIDIIMVEEGRHQLN